MKRLKAKGKKRVPTVAFTIRLNEHQYGRMVRTAESLGWSVQKLTAFLTAHVTEENGPIPLDGDARAMVEQWATALRVQTAKVQAAALIAAARNPGKAIMATLLKGPSKVQVIGTPDKKGK
jgi:hypothetical protein